MTSSSTSPHFAVAYPIPALLNVTVRYTSYYARRKWLILLHSFLSLSFSTISPHHSRASLTAANQYHSTTTLTPPRLEDEGHDDLSAPKAPGHPFQSYDCVRKQRDGYLNTHHCFPAVSTIERARLGFTLVAITFSILALRVDPDSNLGYFCFNFSFD